MHKWIFYKIWHVRAYVRGCVMLGKLRGKHREWHKEFQHSEFKAGYKCDIDLERKSPGQQGKDDTLEAKQMN